MIQSSITDHQGQSPLFFPVKHRFDRFCNNQITIIIIIRLPTNQIPSKYSSVPGVYFGAHGMSYASHAPQHYFFFIYLRIFFSISREIYLLSNLPSPKTRSIRLEFVYPALRGCIQCLPISFPSGICRYKPGWGGAKQRENRNKIIVRHY